MASRVTSVLLQFATCVVIAWCFAQQFSKSTDMRTEIVEQSKTLVSLRHERDDLMERKRFADNLSLQAGALLKTRPAIEMASASDAVATQTVYRFVITMADQLYCQAWISMREIATNGVDYVRDSRPLVCTTSTKFRMNNNVDVLPQLWIVELDKLQVRVEQRLRDLNQALEQVNSEISQLHTLGEIYSLLGMCLAVVLLFVQTAVSILSLMKSP